MLYIQSWAHFYPEKREPITKIARWTLGLDWKLAYSWHSLAHGCQCLLYILPPSVSLSTLGLSSLSQILSYPSLSSPFFCQCLSVFVPLPLHSSKGEHSSQSRSDRGLVLERPLQQERVLLKFPVTLQPAEIQTAIKAKWAKQDCDWCTMKFLCSGWKDKNEGILFYCFDPKHRLLDILEKVIRLSIEWDDKLCNKLL